VDISPFISALPTGQDTREFSTDNASGSTSQAANIVEALEVGAEVLLMDEDTSATNFMVRDRRMQLLVSKEHEPITPFVDRVRELYERLGVSTVLVMGGVGDYFAVADTVIMMDKFEPRVVTEQARAIARKGEPREEEVREPLRPPTPRAPVPASVDPFKRGKVKIQARGVGTLVFGEEVIDLSAVEQLVDPSQTRAIGEALYYALRRGYLDGELTLAEILRAVYEDIGEAGVEVISRMSEEHPGELALPRPLEVAAALNRLRSLAMRQKR
jgi:predicted ABC-class ATPase